MAVVIDGATSLTDVAHWRQFCLDAAADPTLLDRDPEHILSATLEGLEFARARYERVANRIERAFGPLSGVRVLELGGGYGGQAIALLHRYPTIRYYLVDLPEPLALQLTVLRGLPVEPWQGQHVGLFVSSFALSELRRDLQLEWLETVALIPCGFVYWNGWLAGEVSLAEAVERLPASAIIEPCPDRTENRVILWGKGVR